MTEDQDPFLSDSVGIAFIFSFEREELVRVKGFSLEGIVWLRFALQFVFSGTIRVKMKKTNCSF